MEGNSQPTGHMREPTIHIQSNTIKREEPNQREFSLVRPPSLEPVVRVAFYGRLFGLRSTSSVMLCLTIVVGLKEVCFIVSEATTN